MGAQDILAVFEKYLREEYPDTIQGWYGPPQQRTVYKYGGLDTSNTWVAPSVGVGNWTWAGWLMPFHYARYPAEHRAAGIAKAVAGLKTTFPLRMVPGCPLRTWPSRPSSTWPPFRARQISSSWYC